MIRQDWTASGGAPRFGSVADPGANGFDFGMSRPKTGFGYGLLGDTRTLRYGQACADCPPSDPCPNCSGDSGADEQGQIVKVQAPMPLPVPGIGPPPIGLLPQRPPGNVVIGRPTDWWNWTPSEVGDWIKGWVQAQPSEDIEKMCWEEYERDTINCNIKKAYAGAAAARACHEQAAAAYADCRKRGKKSDIPRFDRR